MTLCISLLACTPRSNATLSGNIGTAANRNHFPTDWYGEWAGMLSIWSKAGLSQEVNMQLSIGPHPDPNTHSWTIGYQTDKGADIRKYTIIEADSIGYHYIVDEQNGILLDSYKLGDKLVSDFEVMGSHLVFTYTFYQESIAVDVTMSGAEAVSISGDTVVESDTIPAVSSYAVRVAQGAVLYPSSAD